MGSIGTELKNIRIVNGFSQEQLARETGISQQRISYYESGKHSPSIEDCIVLADFYGVSLDELVGREIKQRKIK